MEAERYAVVNKGEHSVKYLNCPVQVEKTQLLLDRIGKDYICRVVLKSFSRYSQIKAAVVSVVCYGSNGDELGVVSGQKIISDTPVHFGETFGKDTVIKIPYENSAKIVVLINSVTYSDMSVREINPMANKPVKPLLIPIDKHPEPGREIIKEALPKQKITKIDYVYSQNDGYWICTCGQVNSDSEEKCTGCSGLKSAISKIFSKEYVDSVLKERAEKAKIAEEEKKRREEAEKKRLEELAQIKETKKQKRKKRLKIITPIVAILVILIIFSTLIPTTFIPLSKYNKAVKLYGSGDYFGAASIFESITYYKDSREYLYKCAHRTIEFGSYPQSKVTDSPVVVELNSLAGTLPTLSDSNSWTSYGYFISSSNTPDFMWYIDKEYNGEKYRGVYFTSYRPYYTYYSSSSSYSYQYDNGYNTSTVYWFKYEPIKWRILSEENGEALILCDMIIDSQDFYYSDSHHPSGAAANDWAESTIRSWLNDTFYNTAFSELQKSIVVEQTLTTSKYRGGPETTTDNVFLLTKEDVTNSSYGFDTSTNSYNTASQKERTDYAVSQGACTRWWLRSPYTSFSYTEFYVNRDGYVSYNYYVSDTSYGVVPALKIKL